MLEAIPSPEVIEADRLNHDNREHFGVDHRERADILQNALEETCDYARQLWDCLTEVREYLYASLPAERMSGSPATALSSTDHEQAWGRWEDAFAGVTSVLCGPKGDNGFGRVTAEQLAQARRG